MTMRSGVAGFVLLLSLSPLALPAEAGREMTCATGKIRYLSAKKEKTESYHYCFDAKRVSLISENCAGASKCEAKAAALLVLPTEPGEFGKPGFEACIQVGGIPRLIEFQADQKWYKLDWCFFRKDGSFMDTSRLMNYSRLKP